MDPYFEATAFSLEKEEISGVIETARGYEIIKCLNKFDREETDRNKLKIMEKRRESGILMHISSLPSPYGIGNIGGAAYKFIDFLKEAGQCQWQILPLTPTGYGNSPYQSNSTFAGNPYFIDPDQLVQQGLLLPEEVKQNWAETDTQVDYGRLYELRLPMLRKAFARAQTGAELDEFCRAEAWWLDDYALFMAVKGHFGGKPWTEWDADIRLRKASAMRHYQRLLAEEIRFQKWLQYCFFTQWDSLHSYAAEKGISIIGDIPIYVPLDSADVWSAPDSFQLSRFRRPRVVAGCPPDAFTRDGQYWGNPIYDWQAMESDGFSWWIRRIGAAVRFFDVVRIDHFRGIESYWSIPAHHKTARHGTWIKGPGMALIDAIRAAYPHAEFIAEDLGFLTPEVHELVENSGFPSMKVLEFAFDSREPSNYLPHVYGENCVCYTGTHDNPPLQQWYLESSEDDLDRAYARRYMNIAEGEDFCKAIIRLGMASKANLFMVQMQDYLQLSGEARMNEPGVLNARNWRWRMLPGAANAALSEEIAALTKTYSRV